MKKKSATSTLNTEIHGSITDFFILHTLFAFHLANSQAQEYSHQKTCRISSHFMALPNTLAKENRVMSTNSFY